MLHLMPRPARCWIAVAPLLGLLVGCVDLPDPTRAGFSPYMEGPEEVAPERSIVMLPPELETERLAVRRQVVETLLTERVVLANDTARPGENAVRVQTRHRGMPYMRVFSGPLRNPFTQRSVELRVEEEFPGFERVTRPIDRTNQYGPYRYVAATANDAACVFAWQMMDGVAAVSGNVNTYAVDFRFCTSDGDPDRLIALFDQIRLQPHL
ncbi:MAG: cellulose biosynthesis protein BcsN [Geminicoccaceae bacterium]|nr:cellulose biosynthesis protein BcsN [Geminicoccaceae bacterium]